MKKIYALTGIFLFCFASILVAQVTLTYEKHALVADKMNEMQLTEYADPGNGGEGQVWDFTGLTQVKDFKGMLTATYSSENSTLFPETNVELNEFGNRFYFKLDHNSIEQYGLVSNNGNLVITYDKPFVKMKYPFGFGDYFQGNYGGMYKYQSGSTVKMDGAYQVEADGSGKLLLPNNQVIENTLRVRTQRTYSRNYTSTSNSVDIVTYRWYAENIRFPLLVLTEITTKTGDRSHVSHQAAYRENIQATAVEPTISIAERMDVYPNPFMENFTIDYNVPFSSDVLIELYDNAGKKLKVLVDKNLDAGNYSYKFKGASEKLSKGSYFIKYTAGEETSVRTVIQVK